ncbi:hypothetical protein CKO27_17625 [Thiocystis violacea]|nr:hypothetical protein [Thiocystis violacea]
MGVPILALALIAPPTIAGANEPAMGAASETRPIPSETPGDERAALTARLAEVRRLLTQIEVLETQLANQAQAALDRADAARDLDERTRQERLHTEIGARIGALRTTRRDLERQLGELEKHLSFGRSPRDGIQ